MLLSLAVQANTPHMPTSAAGNSCRGVFAAAESGSVVLRLSGYNEREWREYLKDVATQPQGYELNNQLLHLLGDMPSQLRTVLFAQVREAYHGAGKHNMRTDVPVWKPHGPKRALDAFITGVLRPAKIIIAALGEGKSPLEALDAFFDRQRAEVFQDTPYGQYRAEHVLSVAKLVQRELVNLQERIGRTDLIVVMTGSFPSGRGNLYKSDVDLGLSEMPETLQYQRFLTAIDEQLRFLFVDTLGEVELDAERFKYPEHFRDDAVPAYAHLSPVQIRITSNEIELLVWDVLAIDTSEIFDGTEKYPPILELPIRASSI